MIGFIHYLIQWPSAIADLFVTFLAIAMLIMALLYARKPKDEPDEIVQPADAWPPAPKHDIENVA